MNTHDIEPLKYGGDKNDDYVTGWNDCWAAIEADRERRGEPVYQVNMKGCGWEDCSLDRYESAGRAMEQDAKKGLKRWQRRILWSAPQPAEPVKEQP